MDNPPIDVHETVVIDYVQQEVITDGLVENQTLEQSLENTNANDLSALATAAEFVPLLEEPKSDGNNTINNERTEEKIEITNALDQCSNFQEEALKYGVANEESVSTVSAATTPGEYFMTSSYEEMLEILNDYFERTLSKFVVQKKTKNFGMIGNESTV